MENQLSKTDKTSERFEIQAQQMENRISETNEKIELMNRKLAHFTSSFNEKFNSLGEQFHLKQLDKKIEELSIKNSSEEDLNQFLAKIGDKFNEQQAEMNRRVDQIDRKMEKMMEMLIQTAATVGSASPGTQIIAPVQNNVTDTSQIALPQDANIIESSAPQSDPTECMIHPPVQRVSRFQDRDNFLKSQKEIKPEPRATPRRRTRVIDDNSWLTRASTPDNNDDAPQLTGQSAKVPEKTDEEHTPKLAQPTTFHESEVASKPEIHLNSDPNVAHVQPQATPRRRNRVIDDSSWLIRPSTPDDIPTGDVSQLTEQKTKVSDKTSDRRSPKLVQVTNFHELETALKIDSNVALTKEKEELLNNLKLLEENANSKKSNQEISHKLETPLESGCFQKTLNVGSNIAPANENEEPLGDQLLEETADLKKSFQKTSQEAALKPPRAQYLKEIADLKERLLQLDEKQEEFEEKSRMLRENDDVNRQHLENRVQDQLKAQEEQMKLRENELKQRLENKLQEFLETIKLIVRNSAGENGEKSRQQLEVRIQEQLKDQEEQMKLREDKLRMREQELDEKVNEIRLMEEHLGMKVDEIRSGEENLRRKMEKMMELVVQNTATVGTASPGTQVTSPVQDSSIDTSRNEASAPHSDPTDDIVRRSYQADEPTSEDEEIQQIEEQFQRAKAEQDRVYGEKLRLLQEQRREKNEKAEEERKRISGNLTRAASVRHSFHA
ncbi:hypothetical protein CAEBREN_21717 [Caenorhabditis brenneri]|uniref:Uncharacterized protein n=1 Tax=Caenorhabditis brenneri TaxID=135651 RepID=G0MA58_CAEBE|nr:hypothetical protein CAEBREN_21717 [Caenorhabditis brenneri]